MGTPNQLPAAWIFAAQMPHFEMATPDDDGTGKPLAIEVPPNQPAFVQIHYLNAGDEPVVSPVKVEGFTRPAGTDYTPTAAFITYNNSIEIAPGAVGHLESRTCPAPAGSSFWWMSTHSHKQSKHTAIKSGGAELFASNDWEVPGTLERTSAPYVTMPSVTYECTYDNTGSNATHTIHTGPSAATDEMCMAVGYFFPASQPRFCVDNQTF
jgi:hypothetical protein